MKKRTIYLLILTVATVGCVIFGTLWNVGLNFSFSHHNVSGNMVEKSGELEAFDSIVMDMDVMGIEIKNGSGYSIKYCCTDNLIPEYKVKNGVLYVTQEQKIHYNTNNADMTLTLPSGTDLKKIDIRVDVGDVTLSDLTADYCKADSDVGDFTAKNSTLNELILNSDTGDITLKNSDFLTIDAESNVGNIELDSNLNLEDYTFEISTNVGDITVNDHSYDHQYNSKCKDSQGKITMTSDVGDIDITY